jgi:hypothetical protein
MQSAPKVNILLVDDHPENLIALEAILDKLGQNLVKANSGEEALRCLLQQDFAAILLDVQMPGMDGFETATLIRQRERSRNTPIIFLTAFSTNDTLVFKGYALGAVDYLLKPIDPVILTSKVSVFVDLFKKTMEVQQQAAQLAAINAELRQSEQRFRSLSACSPIGIFLTDTTGRCTYTNPICEEICRFKIEEGWEEGWARIIHPEERDRVLADWFSCIRQEQTYSEEFRIYTPDRAVCWVHVRTSPLLLEQKQLLGYVGTVEDITERKQGEAVRDQMIREQAARAEAETANRMKDEFLAIISHELRTPLNSILGWSQLLLTRKFDAAATTRALETIQRNAKSQTQLIEDILDVSKIVRGKLRLLIQPLKLVELIETVVDTVRPLAEAKAIQLETKLAPEAQMVSGDSERLRQIIWNLLSNAIKFTPQGGRVEVRLSAVNSSSLMVNGFEQSTIKKSAQIQVIDTGIGISPDFLPYVFDRFRQADSSSTRSFGGLGLGLTIVRCLVDLHGGKIYAESAGEGQGSTFTLKLPLLEESRGAGGAGGARGAGGAQEHRSREAIPPITSSPHCPITPSPLIPQPSLDGVQVLVVEDNDDTRDFIKIVLEQFKAKVTAVASVSEAMQCLEQSSPDVLVSDIGLPGEDGYQLIHRLRDLEQQRGGKIPAIALTAYARLEDQMQALSAGFQMHIAKPFEPAQLVKVIAQLVEPAKIEELERQ